MSCFAQKLVKRVVPSASTGTGVRAAASVRPSLTDGPNGGYTPAELAKAYGVNANGATTQTVAIVDAFHDPSALADLNHFDAANGLPAETATSFKVVFDTPTQAAPPSDAGWALEITLDVQAVRGLCHKCKILLVEALSDSDSDIGHAVTIAAKHAKIISNSYGTPETDPDATAAVAADYNKPGVAMLASSGDDGWYGWDFWNCASATCGGANQATDSAPSVPASLNTVVGVGGTSLHLTPTGTRAAEEVWNDNGPADVYGLNLGLPLGAAGSGCSTSVAAQRWQSHVSRYSTLGCGAKRSSVDIAADADPFTGFDVWQTFGNDSTACTAHSFCWETIGGTSLSSPLIAAMWALAGGAGASSQPAETLYQRYAAAGHPGVYDVTRGGNGFCDALTQSQCTRHGRDAVNRPNAYGRVDCRFTDSPGNVVVPEHSQCLAGKGYDGPSGIGAPIGLTVFTAASPA
jgi:subtilase family serine protease